MTVYDVPFIGRRTVREAYRADKIVCCRESHVAVYDQRIARIVARFAADIIIEIINVGGRIKRASGKDNACTRGHGNAVHRTASASRVKSDGQIIRGVN